MEAFVELFEPMRAKLFAVAYRLVGPDLAEDVVMDTFLKAWQGLPGFRQSASLKTWVFRIARNRSYDLMRSHKVERSHRVAPDHEAEIIAVAADTQHDTPDQVVVRRELADQVNIALAQLSDPVRQLLLLRYVDDLSYREIADALGIHIGTVMSRLYHAKRKLRAAPAPTNGDFFALRAERSALIVSRS
jgi:RNA polymerase sigma-70 factor (ECF subfamily)